MEQPKWNEYMLPELSFLADGKIHFRKEIIENACTTMGLNETLKNETVSGGEPVYLNRGGWALTYLKQSGLVYSPKRASFIISNLGKELLNKNPKTINEADLLSYPKYQEFIARSRGKSKNHDSKISEDEIETKLTPEEMISNAQKQIRAQVCTDLLEKVRQMDPSSFENLVINVLVSIGYGNGTTNSGIHTGKTGDGGIDGVINQDKLGLDTIYIQAKRYKEGNNVTGHDVRDFVGALQGRESKGSRKGVFITTSDFTKEGKEYAEGIKDGKVVLINGDDLANLMYDNDVGVSESKVIKIKKLDSDFFEE